MTIHPATFPEDKEMVQKLFLDYQEDLGIDLCFQGFQEELKTLPGSYQEPKGVVLLARNERKEAVGIIALKPLVENTCEMKRLFVYPEYRGKGIGKLLVKELLGYAVQQSYSRIKLDTLERLQAAIGLYRDFGFRETEPYNFNPDKEVRYFEKRI